MLPLEWKNIDHKKKRLVSRSFSSKSSTTKAQQHTRLSSSSSSLFFRLLHLSLSLSSVVVCWRRIVFMLMDISLVMFFPPLFDQKNGPKMTLATQRRKHHWEGRGNARKSKDDERETTGADVLRRKTTIERRRRRTTTTTKSRSS